MVRALNRVWNGFATVGADCAAFRVEFDRSVLAHGLNIAPLTMGCKPIWLRTGV